MPADLQTTGTELPLGGLHDRSLSHHLDRRWSKWIAFAISGFLAVSVGGVSLSFIVPKVAEARALARAETLAAQPGAFDTCFGNQMGQGDQSERVLRSVVRVFVFVGERRYTGTAFVLADSAPERGRPNRLITAGHLVNNIMHGSDEIGILDATGRVLGRAKVVTVGVTDVALLEMEHLLDPVYYAAIPGLKLAAPSIPEPGAWLGLVSGPVGAAGGSSGAPLVNERGEVAGLMVKLLFPQKARVKASFGHGKTRRDGAWPAVEEDSFPPPNAIMGLTISEPHTLDAIGLAGAHLREVIARTPSRSVKDTRGERMQVVGFSNGLCVVHAADLGAFPLIEPVGTGGGD